MKGYILMIDDNPLDLKVASKIIESEGFFSATFTDHHQALAWLETEAPKLVLLDLMMPNVSGFQLIPTLKSHAKLKDVPILILSGKNEINDVKKALLLGVTDYIVKPIDPLILQEKIKKSTSKEEINYAEVPLPTEVTPNASLAFKTNIKSLSEFGLSIMSTVNFAKDQIITLTNIDNELFGAKELALRVYSSTPVEKEFFIKLTFVGMSPSHRQFLRNSIRKLWIKQKGGQL